MHYTVSSVNWTPGAALWAKTYLTQCYLHILQHCNVFLRCPTYVIFFMSELIHISRVVRHLLPAPFYHRECDGNVMVPRYQVYTNGYVTFGLNFDSRYPDKFSKSMLSENKRITAQKQGFAMLAPMWTDTFGRFGDVYYHIYDMTKPGSTSTVQTRVKACISLFICSSFHSLNLTIVAYLILIFRNGHNSHTSIISTLETT